MPLISDIFYSVLWFMFVGAATGFVVYFYMKKQISASLHAYKTLESKHKKALDACEALKKETDLEIRARDRKLEIVDGKYLAIQAEYQNAQKAFKTQLEEKNKQIQALQGQQIEDSPEAPDSEASSQDK